MEQNIPKMSDLDPQYWSSGLSAQLMYLKTNKNADEVRENYNKTYLEELKNTVVNIIPNLKSSNLSTDSQIITNPPTENGETFFDYIYNLLEVLKYNIENAQELSSTIDWANSINNLTKNRPEILHPVELSASTPIKNIPTTISSTNENIVTWEPEEPTNSDFEYDSYMSLSSKNVFKAEYQIDGHIMTPGTKYQRGKTTITINEYGGIQFKAPYNNGSSTISIKIKKPTNIKGVCYAILDEKEPNINRVRITFPDYVNYDYIWIRVDVVSNDEKTIYPVCIPAAADQALPVHLMEASVIPLPQQNFPATQNRRKIIDTNNAIVFDKIELLSESSIDEKKYCLNIQNSARGNYNTGKTKITPSGNLSGPWIMPSNPNNKTIGQNNFEGYIVGNFTSATNMTSLYVPDTYYSIDSSAFQGLTSLKELYLSSNIKFTTIPGSCCYHGAIENVVFGGHEERIERKAFLENAITNMVFPSSLNYIGVRAFYGGTKMSNVQFSSSDKLDIHGDAFSKEGYDNITLDFSRCSVLPTLYADFELSSNIGNNVYNQYYDASGTEVVFSIEGKKGFRLMQGLGPQGQDFIIKKHSSWNYTKYQNSTLTLGSYRYGSKVTTAINSAGVMDKNNCDSVDIVEAIYRWYLYKKINDSSSVQPMRNWLYYYYQGVIV